MGLQEALSSQEWFVEEKGFNLGKANFYETIFTIGNGYQGTRGSLEEGIKGELSATYLAGVFDHHDSTVIELVNAPNWLPLRIWINGERLNQQSCKVLEYRRILDFKKGLLYRFTRFEDSQGRRTRYESIRFASFNNQHLCGIKALIAPENYSGIIRVESIIDGERYNLDRKPVYVPEKQAFHPEVKWEKWAKSKHLEFISGTGEENAVYLEMKTMDTVHHIGYASSLDISVLDARKEYRLDYEKVAQLQSFEARQGNTYEIEKLVTIYTSRDVAQEEVKQSCLKVLSSESKKGFNTLIKEHVAEWERKWADCDCV
ncbi:MAG: glycoside hydrolase family 65 protein, partial [Deltaproteobacteria bacterium]|nr:glycoside hydrolase family 65 protein [Deltaproteobacteria bacterium]